MCLPIYADALDALAADAAQNCWTASGLDVERLRALAPAVRSRVLHASAVRAGCPRTDMTAGHVEAVDALVTAWRGQRWVDLPGGVRACRGGGELRFASPTVAG